MKKIIILMTIFIMGCSNNSKIKENDNNINQGKIVEVSEKTDFKLHLKSDHTMVDVNDPLEPLNRRIYYFNYELDRWFALPVSNSYKFFFPSTARTGVKNFFSNLYEPISAVNGILVLDFKVAFRGIERFLINTTIGIGGLFDVATKLDLKRRKRTLDDTLATYGVKPGPYIVLPFLGPSNLRDATSRLTTFILRVPLDPINVFTGELWEDIAITSVKLIDMRSRIPLTPYSTGSPFEYEYVRMLYLKYSDLKGEESY